MQFLRCTLILFCLVAAPGTRAEEACEPVDGITSICGLRAPEDLVLAPGGRFIIFSQMAAGGGLSLLDTLDDSVSRVYPGSPAEPQPGWGSPACPAAPGEELLLHGIHLRQRNDGRWQLLAVNHGDRESMEFFELLPVDGMAPGLVWRGCVSAPENANFNDVVVLPDGGFLATHMFPRDSQTWGAIKSVLGFDTGFVYRWASEAGFAPVPGTAAPMPNGIELSADNRYFFMNSWAGGEVRKYALGGGEILGLAKIQNVDNSSWDSRGSLLVASHLYSWRNLSDGFPPEDGTPVPLHFAIVAVNPETMTSAPVVELHGPPMGGGTVALEAAGHLYIGSYAGDRIIKVPLAELP